MDKEFIVYAETKASFEAAVNSGDVDTSQIGIIGETGELWENGEYHPLVESISLARDLTGREEATAEEFIFRASGGNKSIRDESAVIRRIKGNTLVWNQRIANPNFADGTLRWSANNGSLAVNANGSVRFTHTHTGSQSVSQTFTERIPSGHKVLVVMDYQRGDNTAISSLVYLHKASNGYDRFSFPRIASNARRVEACIITTTDEIRGIMAYPFLNAPAGAYSDIYSINVFDLTQMFGAGNEPSDYSEFKTLFPESCYPYSAPEVRAMRASGIETIGANAFNKEDVVGGVINADDGTVTSNDIYSVADIEVLGNGSYTLTNVANSALTRASYAIYDNDYRLILTGGFADSVRLQVAISGSVGLPENARYMRVVVHNDYLDSCCVNIRHSGALSDATYFKDVRMLPDIIKYFPDGMHGVGEVYDEINAENAIKRCGVRAYEDGDSANGDVMTDGATTVYALEEPVMIPIVDALQLDYNVADYGTEKMLSTQPSTPFRADIVYKFNAVDRIRDNARNIERLEEMIGSSGGSVIDTETIEQLIIGNTDSEVTPDGVKPVSGAAVYSIDVLSRANEHGLALVNANTNASIVAEAVPFIYSNGSITTSSAAVQGYLIPVEGGVPYYNNSAYSFSNVAYLKDRPDINEAYLSNKGYVDIGQQILPPDDCAYLLINSAPSRLITVTKRGELISTLGGVKEIVQDLQQTIEGVIWERDFVVKNGSSLSQVFPNPEGRGAFKVKVDGECITEYSVYYCAQPNMTNAMLVKKMAVGRALTVQVKEQYPYVGIYAIPSKVGNIRLTMSTSAKRTSIMTMLCFGDSLTEYVDKYGYHYSDYIHEFLGCNVYNVGIGGTRLAMRANIGAGEIYAALDMPYLIKSWCDDDYTDVDNAVEYIKTNLSDDNTTIVERLKSIRPTDVDIVTIFGGVNDFMSGSTIGDEDSTSMLDVNGGINTIISNLLAANPALQIFIFTPTVMYSDNSRTDLNWCDNYISTRGAMVGKKLSDVVEVVKAAAKRNHIPCKDMYWELGWNRANFATYFTTPTDSVHPFGGFEWIGRAIANYISAH